MSRAMERMPPSARDVVTALIGRYDLRCVHARVGEGTFAPADSAGGGDGVANSKRPQEQVATKASQLLPLAAATT